MKIFFFLLLLTSCQDQNSNSSDKEKYGPISLDSDPNFPRAFQLIQSRCISCHTGYHNTWAQYQSNGDWLSSGLINRGDANNSQLILRIINTEGQDSDMPKNSSRLPDAEYEWLKKWINEIP
jgi:hypothetical protein